MAFTQDDLDRLDRAVASGELQVRIQDRMVTYRSLDELLRARRAVRQALSGRRSSHALADFSSDE